MTQRETDNDRISRMARSAKDALPFLCECGRTSCFELVWLSPSEFDAHREQHEPLLAHPIESAHLAAA